MGGGSNTPVREEPELSALCPDDGAPETPAFHRGLGLRGAREEEHLHIFREFRAHGVDAPTRNFHAQAALDHPGSLLKGDYALRGKQPAE
eukprot:4928683-Alexandrium_andersonii.AAC.1